MSLDWPLPALEPLALRRKRLMAHAGLVATMVRRLQSAADGHRKRGHEAWAKEFDDAAQRLEELIGPS